LNRILKKKRKLDILKAFNCLGCLTFFSAITLFAQESRFYTLEPLIVTASKIPTTFFGTNRNILVIEREEIENSPANSLADLLKFVSGVNIRERGSEGVQGDIYTFGTFEQTLILIDGIKAGDPQTAHHNLNIPLELEDIERIEILKGPGTRLYGGGAFSGVINIITKKEETEELNLTALAGDYKLLDANISLFRPFGISGNRLSISGKRSDGYRYNTDFDIWNFLFSSSIDHGNIKGDVSLGYNDKEFGANCFYSDEYPDEREHTKSAFFKGGVNIGSSNIGFHLRRHEDDFMLDYTRPEWNRNHHITHTYSMSFQSNIHSKFGSSSVGVEGGGEKIRSTNLGDHSRSRADFFFEQTLPTIKNITMVFGSSFSYYSDWDWFFCPGLDIGFGISKSTLVYASVGKAFRTPSYTELYLESPPANMGDSNLIPEEAISYEAGIKILKGSLRMTFNGFIRNENNIIDWVRADASEPWTATNAGDITVKGLEINASFKPVVSMYKKIPIPKVELGYAFFGTNKEETSLQSKYLLTHPAHKFTVSAEYELSSSLKQNWKGSYEILSDSEKVFILDTRISLELKNTELFIDVTNLLNTEYTEAGWVPMPGRWAKAGIRVSI
jgi:vitamin B12 transporter